MQRLRHTIAALLLTLSFSAATLSPVHAYNFFKSDVCVSRDGADADASKGAVCQQATNTGTENPAVHIIQVATSAIALLGGMLAVIMIIIGGFQFVTSSGSTESAANARKKVVNSLVGLILIALAWTIIRLITDKVIK